MSRHEIENLYSLAVGVEIGVNGKAGHKSVNSLTITFVPRRLFFAAQQRIAIT